MSLPLISVILPVFNCEKYIQECIDSILKQTYQNFEVLIFNDGSTDKTKSILSEYKDHRLKIYHKASNEGYVFLLNEGISLAKGKYICRMDGDDVCEINRFSEQVKFMETYPEVGVSGSFVKVFGNKLSYVWKLPVSDQSLKASLPFRIPFIHPSVIIRKSLLIENNIKYKNEFLPAEDYELWNNLASKTRFANIPLPLIKYRQHQYQISKEKSLIQKINSDLVRQIYFKKLFINEDDFKFYQTIVNENFELESATLLKSLELFNKLEQSNQVIKLFDSKAFRNELAYQAFKIATHLSSHNIKTLKILAKSNYKKSTHVSIKLLFRYLIKNIY